MHMGSCIIASAYVMYLHTYVDSAPYLSSDAQLQTPKTLTRMINRVPSMYVRQLAENNLLIPAKHLCLLGCIGQGKATVPTQ